MDRIRPFLFILLTCWLAGMPAADLRAQAPGSLDTSFDPGDGANGTVTTTALQADGKILLSGVFSTIDDVGRNGIARLNADGSLDAGFDPGAGVDGQINSVMVQATGQIIITGIFDSVGGVTYNRVARLNADGSPDTGFQPALNPDPGFGIITAAVQTDGRIILAGNSFFDNTGVQYNLIVRLNTDGSLDGSFNPNAYVNNGLYALALQPDGKIVLGGSFSTFNGVVIGGGVARLNTDGSLDGGFDPGTGTLYTDSSGTTVGTVRAVAVQPDGKIVVGGSFGHFNGATIYNTARLNADGSLDTGFNPGVEADSTVYAVALQADGSVLLGGDFYYVNGNVSPDIAQVGANGFLDPSFAADGGPNGSVDSIAVQPDGNILIAGSFTTVNGVARNSIARLNGDAPPAPAFTSASNASGQVGQPFFFQVTATNSPTTFGAMGLPPNLNINPVTGQITGTPSQSGTFSITLYALNAYATGTETFTLTIAPGTALTPIIISATTASGQVGVPFNYQTIASEAPTSFRATGLPPGLTINSSTGLISGTPTQPGTFAIVLFATNAGGTGKGSLTLSITTPPVGKPVFTSAPTASAQVGQLFAYQSAATNAPTFFSATDLPTGLSLNASTGLISGVPTVAGSYTVSLEAANASGTGAATLDLNVAAASVTLPTLTVMATVPVAHLGDGQPGVFTLELSAPLAAKIVVKYQLKGSAINGEDYEVLTGKAKIKPGKTTTTVQIVPRGDLAGAASRKVKLIVEPNSAFTVGTAGAVTVKLVDK